MQNFLNYVLIDFLDAGLGGGAQVFPEKGPIDRALFRVSLRVPSPSLDECRNKLDPMRHVKVMPPGSLSHTYPEAVMMSSFLPRNQM